MIFNKKDKIKCKNCSSRINEVSSYCFNCGYPQNPEKKQRTYGLLGKDDFSDSFKEPESIGITDKIINSMMNSLIKNLGKQLGNFDKSNIEKMQRDLQNTEVQNLPNGIRIKIVSPNLNMQKSPSDSKKKSLLEKSPSEEQIKRLSSLPRSKARSSMKRFNNTINYELITPGVGSVEDIFISKLEEGYEIKAIGEKKVYTNTLPVNLPLKRLSLLKNKLVIEFQTEE